MLTSEQVLVDIMAAERRLKGVVTRTPLLTSDILNDRLGAEVWIKPECLQRSGSFKIRGAYNKIASLTPSERARGVVAFSSGNHAQGVALAARLLGVDAVIVMPEDAPAIKMQRTRRDGADVITYDRYSESREDIADKVAAERGATVVPSFEDPLIIAGQGTAGLEAAEDLQNLGVAPDIWMTPLGGGGLMSGTSTAIRATFPACQPVGVEPEGYDDTIRSLASGARESADLSVPTLCDALQSDRPGILTLAVNRQNNLQGVIVNDRQVRAAMRFAYNELKLVVEPGGAVALAALLADKLHTRGKKIAILLSGGNVDPRLFADVIGEDEQ